MPHDGPPRETLGVILESAWHRLCRYLRRYCKVKLYAKAIIGCVVSLTGSLAVAATDNAITLGEGLAAIAAAAAAAGAVYGVSNGKASPG